MNAKFFRNGIVMLVLVAGTVALLWTWLSQSNPQQTVGYSKFLDNVAAGQVKSVVQQGEILTVQPEPAGAAYTVTVPNVLINVYEDIQRVAGDQELPDDIYSARPTPDTSWVGLLLTGLLPLLVIGGFIFFMMRQAQGTNNQALSFGKSRARM
ncbi:MAG TPA: ATP-dependent metallopeptidase FtsH/Yme1/Tma family protein, partial [Candidatus Limnocylindrales bacterium]|nr:ATP-dependent metallopeptidase FtsH/Yme1/Tma family protein [Candidatus Limnocylindrales bacterium]